MTVVTVVAPRATRAAGDIPPPPPLRPRGRPPPVAGRRGPDARGAATTIECRGETPPRRWQTPRALRQRPCVAGLGRLLAGKGLGSTRSAAGRGGGADIG